MRNSEPLKILYEISETAKKLSKELNLSWDLEKKHTFDNFFYVRLTNTTPIIFNPISLTVVSTGLYIQLTEPTYEVSITPYMNLLRKKGLGVINNRYDFNFINELKVLIFNYSSEEKIINPGDIIGCLSINSVAQIETAKVTQIEQKQNKTKDNNWVQEDKKLESSEESIISSNFSIDTTPLYTENSINNLIDSRLR
jgi:dUTPase